MSMVMLWLVLVLLMLLVPSMMAPSL